MSKRYLDFNVKKEDWSVYSLRDGTKIKIRFILESVSVKGQRNEATVDVKTIVLCDESVCGEPTQEKYTQEQRNQNVDVSHCEYTTMHHEPSEYILDDNTRIIIHHNVLNIARTHLFDHKGDRIYNVKMGHFFDSVPANN